MAGRGSFSSKIGVIAATVGSAVGLGNIWRFPYETGQHGGAAFLLIYIICIIILGIPVMLSEFIIGRSTHANVSGAFKKLSPNGKWYYTGILAVVASIMILGFYTVIAGWTLEYVYQAATFGLTNKSTEQFVLLLTDFNSNPYRPIVWITLFLVLNYAILVKGISNGIEKASNILMPLLFCILIIFCIRSMFMPAVKEGLSFLFKPDFSKIDGNVILGAMGQAFFSLSLGMGTLITYSSYFKKDIPLLKTATTVAVLDTLVAILAGLIIFPIVFSFGMAPEQGPKLVFVVLPNIFEQLPGGYFWSLAFFILLTVAALTSTVSLFEVGITYFSEKFNFSRKKSTLILIFITLATSTICSLSFGPLGDIKLFNKNIFELFDFTTSNILLPLGGLFISIYVGWKLDPAVIKRELSNNGTLNTGYIPILTFCIKYIAPLIISLIFIRGLM